MEKESFFSGYCRTIDQSRMVAVVTEDKEIIEIDCCFESCIHAHSCTIAEQIWELIEH